MLQVYVEQSHGHNVAFLQSQVSGPDQCGFNGRAEKIANVTCTSNTNKKRMLLGNCYTHSQDTDDENRMK